MHLLGLTCVGAPVRAGGGSGDGAGEGKKEGSGAEEVRY